MSFIQNLFTSRDNNANGASYVGQQDRIWWNPDTNAFYYSDGNTAGGIPIGAGGSGNGVPGGPTNSIQINAGGGNFTGTSSLTWSNPTLAVVGNITTTNILTNGYLYANGTSIFANSTFTGNVNLGNLYIADQTIGGKNINGNITLLPEGSGWVNVPKIAIENSIIANIGGKLQFDTPAGVDIQFAPGTLGNILTAGNVVPTGNNLASLGSTDNRYTGLWLGSGDINLIDRTLNQNQQMYADNGNIVFANSSGAQFGNFRFYGNTMALANAAANLVVGTANATGWVQFNRSIAVSTSVGATAFSVNKSGLTSIFTPSTITPTQASLNIVGTSSGNVQPRNFNGTLIQATGQDNTPARISFDAFGSNGAQNSYVAIAGRAARGTVDTPTALQVNDLMMRFTSQGWTGNGVYASSIARLNFAAAESFTSNTSVGTYANIQLTPIGTDTIKTVIGFSANGVVFANASSGGTGNLGITFQDGTYQNTAFSNTQVVTSATAATGITVTPASTGNIVITNTGVITVAGTSNQVFVNGANNIAAANGAITLSLPQDIAPSSSPTFNNLTVGNLSIIGNVSNVIPATVNGPIVYVANTATQLSDINNSGLITGNAANGYYAGILYNTTSNTWDMRIGNSAGITANLVLTGNANIQTQLHVGNATAHLDYPYAVIQGDMDVNTYAQILLQNHNQGANASADYVAVNNIGNDGNNYIDMGINSNVYNNNDYAVTKANDGYLYVNGGNLVIGTQSPAKVINFFTGGTNNSANFVRATITDTGLSVAGNINSANVVSANLVTGVTVSASGNVTGNNVNSLNIVSAQGNVVGQNLTTTGVVSATGNIVGGNIRAGSGSISTTGNVVAGNLVTLTTLIDGGVSTSGNITGANILTSGRISATGNIDGSTITANLAVVGDTLSILGNIVGGNLSTSGLLSTTGNVAAGNVNTAGRISVTGNVDAGNLRTGGTVAATTVSTTGNITGSYFLGNGSQLTGLNAFQTVAANGTNLLANSTSGILTLTPGNNIVITGNATTDTATIAVNNNPTFGNVGVTNISVSGNITGANVGNIGNVTVTGNIQYNLATDDGGNVTQLTNKSTAVTCNGRTGRITTSGAALSGSGSVTFVVNNTYVQQYDVIILNIKDPIRANTYQAQVVGVGVNSFNIMITNVDNGSHSDAIILSFALIQVR
jgi:hypothetical protein